VVAEQLQSFLDQNALFLGDDYAEDVKDYVHLMTVHRAKFSHVIITGLEEDIFPLPCNFDDRKLEEERRLFYVALTRAKEQISLYYAGKRRMYGKTHAGVRSKFIDEIPERLLLNKSYREQVKDFSRGFSLRPKISKLRNFDETGKYRLGQAVFHQELGDGIIFKIDGNKVEFMVNGKRVWLNEDDPLLKRV